MSLAFEVVTTEDTTVQSSGYDIIRQPLGRRLDPYSLYIHSIYTGTARSHGKPLHKVLSNLAPVVQKHRPVAVVGHDVQGDVGLLISECLRSNLNPNELFGDLFRRLVCTKIGSAVLCGTPLPDGRYGRHKKNYIGSPPSSSPEPLRLKWPNLTECYERLVCAGEGAPRGVDNGKEGKGTKWPSHDARGDVERCRAVFFHLIFVYAAKECTRATVRG